MKQFLALIILFSFLSCETRQKKTPDTNSFQLLIPDTTNNSRAQWDLSTIEHCSEIAKQLNLSDIKRGTDSLEIRLWHKHSFSSSEELYILKCVGTIYSISYYRFYAQEIRYFDDDSTRGWNSFKQPLLDSSFSKNVSLKTSDTKHLDLDNIWKLHSQSELKIPDSIGFNDCDSYAIEIADRKRYKFLKYHCPNGYIEQLKLTINDTNNFLKHFAEIASLAEKHNATIPYRYD
jgi:hypothetical protein